MRSESSGALLCWCAKSLHARPALEPERATPSPLPQPPVSQPSTKRRSCFALEDQKEGMAAFVQKRAPEWQHK